MKKKFLIILICLITNLVNGQEIFIGGGAIGTVENPSPSTYESRFGVEGTFEIKPFSFGLVGSISPNVLFDKDGTLYTLPFELKWLFGNKYKVYPAIGYVIRNHSFTGSSMGLGFEIELNEQLKSGIKCSRVGGIYNPEPDSHNSYAEISIQVGVYLLKKIR